MAVYFSFHYDRDNWRVQQVLNMGVVDGQPLLSAQDWEAVRRQGDAAIRRWIDDQMKYKRAVVVLVGASTASRPWVLHEIRKAWDENFPLVGVRIHGLRDRVGSTDGAGANPFAKISLKSGATLDQLVPLHSPAGSTSQTVYESISTNLNNWIGSAPRLG